MLIQDRIMASHKKAVTQDYLNHAAQYYLARYASSRENLRNVLMRKVESRLKQAVKLNPDEDIHEAEYYAPLVDKTIDIFEKAGLLNDKNYAEMRTATLQARGMSGHMIRLKLSAKGIDRDMIRQILDEAAENGYDDRQAACKYAQRRKLGGYRTDGKEENHRKDLARMMRVGFSYEDSCFALNPDDWPE